MRKVENSKRGSPANPTALNTHKVVSSNGETSGDLASEFQTGTEKREEQANVYGDLFYDSVYKSIKNNLAFLLWFEPIDPNVGFQAVFLLENAKEVAAAH